MSEIGTQVNSHVRAKDFLKKREDYPRIAKSIDNAKENVWIAGFTLGTIANEAAGYIRKKLTEGVDFQLLSINPDGKEFDAIGRHFGWTDLDKAQAYGHIKNNLYALSNQYNPTCMGKLEIRMFNGILPTGLLIVDHKTPEGFMNVQLYPYQVDANKDGPLFSLTKKEDQEWFGFYIEQFWKLWNNSDIYHFTF